MKVLHFGRFYNAQFGGLERHVDLLVQATRGRLEQVANVVANERFALDIVDREGYRIYKVPTLGVWFGTPLCPTMSAFVNRLQRDPAHAFDINHLHFPDPTSHLAWNNLKRPGRLVVTWHSDIIRQRLLLKAYRPFLLKILARADAIIVATPKHIDASPILSREIAPRRICVVPFGIDTERFQAEEVKAAAVSLRASWPSRPVIFAVGRHVYYKGFEYLIDAMQRLPDAFLVLGGTGPLTQTLKRRVGDLGLTDRIHFPGRIPDAILPAYYHAADLVCMPSVEQSEAFGLVQLEAMACRKPVVSCELNNGVTYVNRDGLTGRVVPPRDSKALAHAIDSLLRDEVARRQLGGAGYQRVIAEFSVDQMANGTYGVYQQVLHG